MPTALPRLQVTLTAPQRALLARVAKANGTSQSKILAELLDAAAPVLVRLIAAVENVQKLDAQKRDLIRSTIEDAQREAEEHAATALALLERISQPPSDRPPQTAAQRSPEEPPVVDLAAVRVPRRRRPPPANRGRKQGGYPVIRIDLENLLTDDYLTVTAPSGPLEIARYLTREKPDVFAWESSGPTKRYACTLTAPGGIQLAYAKRNPDGLNAPQSDSRDSDDWMLQVPGRNAHDLATLLLAHPLGPTMQAPRRDIAFTARFDDPAHVYDLFADLVQSNLGREPHKHGPRTEPWQGVTLQTHEKPSTVERSIVLYDKHAQDPATFPDDRTIRLEVRLTPKDKADKIALLRATRHAAVTSWRTARKVLEVVLACPLDKSFTWNATPADAFDLEAMTRHLLASYGPTIRAGIDLHGSAYLVELGLAALLLASNATQAAAAAEEPAGDPREARMGRPMGEGVPAPRAEATS